MFDISETGVPDEESSNVREDLLRSLARRGRFRKNHRNRRRKLKITLIVCLSISFLLFLVVFVIFPLVFMWDVKLQRLLMFMNVGLPTDPAYFQDYNLSGLTNLYASVNNSNTGEFIHLGVWNLLPHKLANSSDIQNHSLLWHFHGSGEARSDFINKTNFFRNFFHVINFDYRSFADSSRATLSEKAVIADSVQLYRWIKENIPGNVSMYIWGHSLGAALAASTAAAIEKEGNGDPAGLVLESAFTSMRSELPVHPYGRIFAWLPWFKATVLDPLAENGFLFDTSKHVSSLKCPLLILHARDDPIVPYTQGRHLYLQAKARNLSTNVVMYKEFPAYLNYEHNYIYEDPQLPVLLENFLNMTQKEDLD